MFLISGKFFGCGMIKKLDEGSLKLGFLVEVLWVFMFGIFLGCFLFFGLFGYVCGILIFFCLRL